MQINHFFHNHCIQKDKKYKNVSILTENYHKNSYSANIRRRKRSNHLRFNMNVIRFVIQKSDLSDVNLQYIDIERISI